MSETVCTIRFPSGAVGVASGDRETFLARRAASVGASEIAMALQASKYGDLRDLVLRKRGDAPKTEESDHMQDGRDLEDGVLRIGMRRLAREYFHKSVPRVGQQIHVTDPRCDRLSATPDAVLVDEQGTAIGVVETKVDRSGADWREVDERGFAHLEPGDLRLSYFLQVQAQLACTGCSVGYLVVWTGYDVTTIRIHADAYLHDVMRDAAKSVFAWVGSGSLPPATNRTTEETLRATLRQRAERTDEAPDNVAAAMRDYADASRAMKTLEDRRDAAKRTVLLYYASSLATRIRTDDGYSCTIVEGSARETLDLASLRRDRPDLVEQLADYIKTSDPLPYPRISAPKRAKRNDKETAE